MAYMHLWRLGECNVARRAPIELGPSTEQPVARSGPCIRTQGLRILPGKIPGPESVKRLEERNVARPEEVPIFWFHISI